MQSAAGGVLADISHTLLYSTPKGPMPVLQAFQVVTWAQRVAVAAMAVAALFAAAAVGAGSKYVGVWAGLGLGAAAAAAAAWRLGLLRQKFVFVDYVQADH